MRTVRITGHSGCELNHTFDTESTGALDPIYLSSNNSGVVFQTKVNAGTQADPATPYVITFTIESAATVVAGPKDILLSTNTGVNGTNASITDAMAANDVAAALRATTLEGYVITGATNEVIVTSVAVGNSFASVGIDTGDDVNFTSSEVEVIGTFSGGGKKDIGVFALNVDAIVAGTLTVQFNDELPIVPIEIAGTESASDVYDLIVAATPVSHTSVNFSGQAVIITNNTVQENIQRVIINPGVTGIEVSTLTYQDGVDPDQTDPKATSVATEYTLDTISNVRSGTALWNEIETIASGNTKLATLTYPITALRLNVKVAATDSTTQVILRTSA